MSLLQFLLILQGRYKIVRATFFITVLTTVVVSLVLPKTYTATATLVVNNKGVDPVTGLAAPGQLSPGYIPTQVDIIQSKNVALKVIEDLKLAELPAVKEDFADATNGEGDIKDWLAELLLKKLDVVPGRETSVIDVRFSADNPQFAAAVANAFANAYQRTSIELKVDPVKKASHYFDDQIKQLRDGLEKAQSNLSAYQQKNHIYSVDNRLDIETARLNELSSQLVAAETQLIEATSRKKGAQGNLATQSPDVISNPVIQNLKISLAQAESKFAQVSQNLGENHPQYQAAKAEVEKLRNELAGSVSTTSGSVANNATILSRRTGEIKAALQAQKEKVLELNKLRDELAVRAKEVESAQRAYDVATSRLSQSNLDGGVNLSDVSILNNAVPPVKPSRPKILLNLILSIFMGGMLGVVFGVLAEMIDRRVHSKEDLISALNAPMLGALIMKNQKRRRITFFRKPLTAE